MSKETLLTFGISGIAAAIPILIWLYILFKKDNAEKKYLALSFLGGILAVSALMGLKEFWSIYPQYDIFTLLGKKVNDPKLFFASTYIVVGIMEEIVKQFLLRYLDTKKAVIKSIKDSIKYSLVAALGFAFAENIFYLESTYTNFEGFSGILVVTYVFRSTFTTAGHMCFSGLFGYFYGMGRFASSLAEEAKLEEKKFYFTKMISRIFGYAQSGLLSRKLMLEGLIIAIVIHGIFNFILSLDQMFDVPAQVPSLLAMGLIVISFIYLQFLLKRNTAQLELFVDVSQRGDSKISRENSIVVTELIAQWIKEEKFTDAISTANRLLEKDPSNTSVQMLKARAIDGQKGQANAYQQMIGAFKENPETSTKDSSVLEKFKTEGKNSNTAKVTIDTSHDNDFFHLDK